MAQTILIKRSGVANKVPTSAQLVTGELALNTVDGKGFMNTAGTITELGSRVSSLDVSTQGGTALGNGSVTIQNDLAVNGTDDSVADITTTAPTFNLATANATTVNAFLAGTAINVGSSAAGSTTTFNSDEVVFNTSTSIQIPVGTTAERPLTATRGDVRYNTTLSTFEGYDGIAWGSLGGVIDVPQTTYVLSGVTGNTTLPQLGSAQTLSFVTNGNLAGTWDQNMFTVNTSTTLGDTSADTLTVNATATFAQPATFTQGINVPAGAGTSTFSDGLTVATGQAFTFDGLAFTNTRKFTVKDSSGSILWGGWALDTDAVATN